VWLPLAFVVALAQQPLYFANQTTKFLHGAAAAGVGQLRADWTALTIDPLPAFSYLIELLYRLQAIELSYGLFALLAALYAYSLTSCARIAGLLDDRRPLQLALFATLFLVFHALAKRGPEGLADQYLLGRYFQPCVFGVLLLTGVQCYLRGRILSALALCAAAATMHPDYLPTALMCGGVFCINTPPGVERSGRRMAFHLGAFLLLLAPGLVHLLTFARPTTPALWQESMHVLTKVRIPHHASVATWLTTGPTLIRLLVMTVGTLLVTHKPLRAVMGALWLLTVGSVVGLAIFPQSTLEAITPWRASVVLMPLALTVIGARCATWVAERSPVAADGSGRLRNRAVALLCVIVTIAALGTSIGRQQRRVDEYRATASMPVIALAKAGAAPGQRYLVPPREQDFDRFRLETGLPIVVNWKTHPYKDTELLEWLKRYNAVAAFYAAADSTTACRTLAGLASAHALTHAIVPTHHVVLAAPCVEIRATRSTPAYVLLDLQRGRKESLARAVVSY
jgi:hypothetical protein